MKTNMYNFSDPRKTKIEFTSQDIEDANRILSVIARAGATEGPIIHRGGNRRERAMQIAAAMVSGRERRAEYFNASMFGEPAWDVLLALFLAESAGLRANINTITRSAGVAPTTALRWIDYLENQRLIEREKHPTDARVSMMRLTEKANQALEAYLLETLP